MYSASSCRVAPGGSTPPSTSSDWSTRAGGISASAATRNERLNGLPAGLPLAVGRLEQVGDAAADPRVEQPGHAAGEHDLIGRGQRGQVARDDRDPVLPEPLAVQAPVDGGGQEGRVRAAR